MALEVAKKISIPHRSISEKVRRNIKERKWRWFKMILPKEAPFFFIISYSKLKGRHLNS